MEIIDRARATAKKQLRGILGFLGNEDACCGMCNSFGTCDETRTRKTDVDGRTAVCAYHQCTNGCSYTNGGNRCPYA